MSLTTQGEVAETPRASIVRQALLDGLASVRDFAEGAGRAERTIQRWIAQGMPSVRIGQTPHVIIVEAADWLRRRSIKQIPPRRPGRPSIRAAA